MSQLAASFTEEEKGQILTALLEAFKNIPRIEEKSEAEVEGIVYTRVRSNIGNIIKDYDASSRFRGEKRNLCRRLGPNRWRTFMELYRAARDEQEEKIPDQPEVILAHMQASINRSGAIINEMETLNSQAVVVGSKITALEEEIENG